MVLMAGERGAASESLLAVGIRALVRTLAGVDAAMASQRARVTEWLCFGQQRSGHVAARAKVLPCRNARTCVASRLCVLGSEQSVLTAE